MHSRAISSKSVLVFRDVQHKGAVSVTHAYGLK